MAESHSIVCPVCSEKNNPSLAQCWKCKYPFANMTSAPTRWKMSRLALIAGILTSFFAAFINIQFMFSAGKIAIAAIDGMFILFLAVALIFLPAKEKKMAQDFTAGFFIGLGLLPLIAFGLCCGAICFPSLLNLGK